MSLNYYPHRHILELNPHFVASLRDETTTNAGSDTHTQYNQIYMGANYGLIPRLRVGISTVLLWDQVTEGATPVNGSQNAATSAGPSAPTFTVAWRVLEGPSSGLSGDLTYSYTPQIDHQVSANAASNIIGNNIGSLVNMGTATLFWRMDSNELGLAFSSTQRKALNVETVTPNTNYTRTSFVSSSLTLLERFHLSPRYFLGGQLIENFGSSYQTIPNSGPTKNVNINSYLNYTAAFGFRPEPYSVISFALSWNQVPTSSVSTDGTTGGSSENALVGQLTFLHQLW
jgi:hypothetical protein